MLGSRRWVTRLGCRDCRKFIDWIDGCRITEGLLESESAPVEDAFYIIIRLGNYCLLRK